jgi:hypothetical protein
MIQESSQSEEVLQKKKEAHCQAILKSINHQHLFWFLIVP